MTLLEAEPSAVMPEAPEVSPEPTDEDRLRQEWLDDLARINNGELVGEAEITRLHGSFGKLSARFAHSQEDEAVPITTGNGGSRLMYSCGRFRVEGFFDGFNGLWEVVEPARSTSAEAAVHTRHYIFYETGRDPKWELAHHFTLRQPTQDS